VLLAALPAWAEPRPAVTIAVLPVVVHSAEDPRYLRAGLTDMLVARLEQVRVFEVKRIDDPALATTSLSRALETAREQGVDFVLFGSFTRFGMGASLDMQCASTRAGIDGETLREIFVHAGSIGDVIPDLDELVGKISRFAVAGYDESASATPAAPGPGRNRPSTALLRQRVEFLEREVRELKREGEEAKLERAAQREALDR
jgi:TolB-like protein